MTDSKTATELLCCPHCNGKAMAFAYRDVAKRQKPVMSPHDIGVLEGFTVEVVGMAMVGKVMCQTCGACTEVFDDGDASMEAVVEMAIETWNRRAS